MKKMILSLLVLALTTITFGQVTEGSVKFKIDMTADDPQAQAQLAMFAGSTMEMFFSPDFGRVNFSMGMLIQTATIINIKSESGITLMSGMVGNKAIPMTKEDFEKDEAETKNFELEKTKETKKILGYKCTKYIVTTEDGTVLTYWVTPDIKVNSTGNKYIVEGMEGFPLEFETGTTGFKMVCTATEFKDTLKGQDKQTLFDTSVPEGYEEMSMEELENMGLGM